MIYALHESQYCEYETDQVRQMTLTYSKKRAVEVAHNLPTAISGSELFIPQEKTDYSPPAGVTPGSLEHVLFLTLTLSIDNGCDSKTLWNSSRRAYEAENTRYLFSDSAVYEEEVDQIIYDLKNTGLGGNKNKNAEIWKNAGTYLFQKWGGDPRNFLRSCEWDGPEILSRMIPARYHEVYDFQHFIGEKKGQLWLHLLKKDAGLQQIKNLNTLSLITDVHVVRASIAIGIIYGSYSGQVALISQKVREIWEETIGGAQSDGRDISTLELSESLHNLSKNGCSQKDGKRGACPCFTKCPFNMFCVNGIFSIENKGALIDTTPEHPIL